MLVNRETELKTYMQIYANARVQTERDRGRDTTCGHREIHKHTYAFVFIYMHTLAHTHAHTLT